MTVSDYMKQLQPLNNELVDIENTIAKLQKEEGEIKEKIFELTKEFKESSN